MSEVAEQACEDAQQRAAEAFSVAHRLATAGLPACAAMAAAVAAAEVMARQALRMGGFRAMLRWR